MDVRRLTYPCPDMRLLMLKFYSEHRMGGLKHLSLDEPKAQGVIDAFLMNGAVFGVFDGEVLAGSIAMHEGPFWWSDQTALWDGWFYVAPEYRRSSAGSRLLKAARQYADSKNLPLIISVSHSDDLDRKAAFFNRNGFQTTGASFTYGA